jgi:hypothetical protein
MAFGLALQFALLRTFAPAALPDLLSGANLGVVWTGVLGLWIAGAWLGYRELSPRPVAADPKLDQYFREAQTEFLKGHWIEAEALLVRLLSQEPGDVEGRLLLASVLRRTRRLGEAQRTLAELGRCERAGRWAWEIENERKAIAACENDEASEPEEGESGMSRAA